VILTPQDTERFYSIWFPLLHFVNQQRQLVAAFPASYGPGSVATEDAARLRDALWADDGLRAAFVAQNPAQLAAADLALVASWQHRVAGKFFFFRQLKKHAILLEQAAATRAYAVLGLVSPIEEIVPLPPPALVTTVLLPFEGKIIYDSLMIAYNLYFGGGIRSELNDAYRAAQERGTLFMSLEPPTPGEQVQMVQGIRARNSKLLTAFQKGLPANVSAPKAQAHGATIERFGEEYLLRQEPPRGLIALQPGDVAAYRSLTADAMNLVSLRHFVRFLRDSGNLFVLLQQPFLTSRLS
jgi:hypothetical protein